VSGSVTEEGDPLLGTDAPGEDRVSGSVRVDEGPIADTTW